MNKTALNKYEYFHCMTNRLEHIKDDIESIEKCAPTDSETSDWAELQTALTQLQTALTHIKTVSKMAADHEQTLLNAAITPKLAKIVHDKPSWVPIDNNSEDTFNKNFHEYVDEKDLVVTLNRARKGLSGAASYGAFKKMFGVPISSKQIDELDDEADRLDKMLQKTLWHSDSLLEQAKSEIEKLTNTENKQEKQKNEEN